MKKKVPKPLCMIFIIFASTVSFRIAFYYLHTEEWAQEVVLDVFLKIWECRESLHHITDPEDYFFITIKNASLNYLEKEQRWKDVAKGALGGSVISVESPEDILVSEELFAFYVKALDRLPERMSVRYLSVYVKKNNRMPRLQRTWV